nr:E-beta-farnesene synthase [Tanacetum cinerariifolium]
MADVTGSSGQVPTVATPVPTDEEIVPRNRWVQIRKSNCYLDLDKKQSNPIYKMAVDLLMHTNFHRAFTASSTRPSIYIQQFWDTIQYDKKAGSYKCQLDEQWIWEEFTQSIHTFIEDKRNLSRHTTGKKRATLIVIPSIRLTKLIVHHLQRRHKFHLRPDSSIHLPNEEPILGYLKFSAKGSKREVFRIPIPGSLITSDIQTASYYQEYLASVTKHRKYLAGKTERSSRIAYTDAHQAHQEAQVNSTQGTSKAFRLHSGYISTTCTHISTGQTAGEKAQVTAEDAELQKVLEESMKTAYAALPRGPLPPVVIRKPESGKYQPLSEVSGKGKAKVTEEQVAHDLLSLQ